MTTLERHEPAVTHAGTAPSENTVNQAKALKASRDAMTVAIMLLVGLTVAIIVPFVPG